MRGMVFSNITRETAQLAVGNEIYDAGASGATAYGSTTFKATIEKVFPSYVLVSAPNPFC